jgi:hypothetical protein
MNRYRPMNPECTELYDLSRYYTVSLELHGYLDFGEGVWISDCSHMEGIFHMTSLFFSSLTR